MEYKVEIPKEIAEIYEEASKYSNISVEQFLAEALISYIGTCLN